MWMAFPDAYDVWYEEKIHLPSMEALNRKRKGMMKI